MFQIEEEKRARLQSIADRWLNIEEGEVRSYPLLSTVEVITIRRNELREFFSCVGPLVAAEWELGGDILIGKIQNTFPALLATTCEFIYQEIDFMLTERGKLHLGEKAIVMGKDGKEHLVFQDKDGEYWEEIEEVEEE